MAKVMSIAIGEAINEAEKSLALMKQIETLHPDTRIKTKEYDCGFSYEYEEKEDLYRYIIDISWNINSKDDLLR